jgi:hypothetical protein
MTVVSRQKLCAHDCFQQSGWTVEGPVTKSEITSESEQESFCVTMILVLDEVLTMEKHHHGSDSS